MNILLVDDHSVIRLGVLFIIKEMFGNPVIHEAETWGKATELIDHYPIDLAILDIEIPGGKGLDMISLLRTKKPYLKVLMFTAFDEHVYALRYLDQGAHGFIQKTANDQELRKAIGNVSAGKQYISTAIKDMIWESRLKKGKSIQSNPFELLSNRELEVCKLMVKGLRLSDIAAQLQLHTSTVGTYKNNIFQKLQVNNIRLLLDKFHLYQMYN
ncbi:MULTISPECIES: response regulator [Olivibacter]|jgi:DNA-binding NarL/FixJ family response regulator|uniref:Response regulator n=1 Tax=Olivibacter oleidegradans TaxID=760123 RepID=A0ABV6HHW5_9SPHI|nr:MULTISPECIES: response regulator transcription factor [Olivibacter]MDM8176823.1 response regulator transcription factor [Olivibacter sp. 47]QEL00630.1 response regulator transcription factor [Olivibacter sp. LS-1]